LHRPETHIVPLVIEAALGRRDAVEIYGTDYPTNDGSAIRDFIHVTDLAEAHLLALGHLLAGKENLSLNLGTGRGVSVLDVIRTVERHGGVSLDVRPAPRRLGDPPALIADPSRATALLGWRPKFSAIEDIVSTAWRWHENLASVESWHPDSDQRHSPRRSYTTASGAV
jgi:UDP-glucose 4-epimerase